MYAGAFLLWKREGNDDIINSALDVEGKNAHRELEKGQKKPVNQKMFKVV